ncbi:MAG: hypothetical protein ACOCXF_00520 [bacterium]
MKVFVEAQAGSPDKHDYNEQTLEFKGIRSAVAPYPYPYVFIYTIFTRYPEMQVRVGELLPKEDALDFIMRYQDSGCRAARSADECPPVHQW